MTQTAKVILNRLLVKPVEKAERNVGGIITFVGTAGDAAYVAEIVTVGLDVKNTVRLTPGTLVVLGKSPLNVRTGARVLVDGVEHYVIKEEDILVILP
jgi:co-chaperonin GroES (HSP10)